MINCRPVLLSGTIENVHENVIYKNKKPQSANPQKYDTQLTHKNITQQIILTTKSSRTNIYQTTSNIGL